MSNIKIKDNVFFLDEALDIQEGRIITINSQTTEFLNFTDDKVKSTSHVNVVVQVKTKGGYGRTHSLKENALFISAKELRRTMRDRFQDQ